MKMLLIDEKEENVKTVTDLFRALKGPVNQIITNQNEMNGDLGIAKEVSQEANQRSKTNRWFLGILFVTILSIAGAAIGGVF